MNLDADGVAGFEAAAKQFDRVEQHYNLDPKTDPIGAALQAAFRSKVEDGFATLINEYKDVPLHRTLAAVRARILSDLAVAGIDFFVAQRDVQIVGTPPITHFAGTIRGMADTDMLVTVNPDLEIMETILFARQFEEFRVVFERAIEQQLEALRLGIIELDGNIDNKRARLAVLHRAGKNGLTTEERNERLELETKTIPRLMQQRDRENRRVEGKEHMQRQLARLQLDSFLGRAQDGTESLFELKRFVRALQELLLDERSHVESCNLQHRIPRFDAQKLLSPYMSDDVTISLSTEDATRVINSLRALKLASTARIMWIATGLTIASAFVGGIAAMNKIRSNIRAQASADSSPVNPASDPLEWASTYSTALSEFKETLKADPFKITIDFDGDETDRVVFKAEQHAFPPFVEHVEFTIDGDTIGRINHQSSAGHSVRPAAMVRAALLRDEGLHTWLFFNFDDKVSRLGVDGTLVVTKQVMDAWGWETFGQHVYK